MCIYKNLNLNTNKHTNDGLYNIGDVDYFNNYINIFDDKNITFKMVHQRENLAKRKLSEILDIGNVTDNSYNKNIGFNKVHEIEQGSIPKKSLKKDSTYDSIINAVKKDSNKQPVKQLQSRNKKSPGEYERYLKGCKYQEKNTQNDVIRQYGINPTLNNNRN